MLRAIVRRLIGPVVRWAARDACFGVGVFRCEHGVQVVVCHPFGGFWRLPYSVEEARETGRAFLLAARDAQEGTPIDAGRAEPPP